jgi:hypothetical protein
VVLIATTPEVLLDCFNLLFEAWVVFTLTHVIILWILLGRACIHLIGVECAFFVWRILTVIIEWVLLRTWRHLPIRFPKPHRASWMSWIHIKAALLIFLRQVSGVRVRIVTLCVVKLHLEHVGLKSRLLIHSRTCHRFCWLVSISQMILGIWVLWTDQGAFTSAVIIDTLMRCGPFKHTNIWNGMTFIFWWHNLLNRNHFFECLGWRGSKATWLCSKQLWLMDLGH